MDFAENKPEQGEKGLDLQTMLMRLGLVLVFLFSLLTAFVGWYLVGGTGHFEITGWFWKFGLCLAWALAITAAAYPCLSQRDGWEGRARRWVVAALLIAAAMGSVTYYYHLQEPPEDEMLDDQSTARL